MTSLASVAVGVPFRFIGDGWDPAPLLLAVALVVLLRLAGLSARLPLLATAVVGGLLLDLLTDLFDVSPAIAITVVGLVSGISVLGRDPAR